MELTIEQRLAIVRENMDKAGGGREIRLVGVTKTKPVELVRRAVAAGLDTVGENYVQEFRDKSAGGAYEGAEVHIIGHLQKNKAKYIVGRVALIQSVDSLELMEIISRRAGMLDTVQDILLEVNIGREQGKSGVSPEGLEELLCRAGALPGLRVRGLMAIPPAENSTAYFARMNQLYIDNKEKKYDNVSMDFLSMGMSDDYIDAIREGANMIRVGSYLFGARNYAAQGG